MVLSPLLSLKTTTDYKDKEILVLNFKNGKVGDTVITNAKGADVFISKATARKLVLGILKTLGEELKDWNKGPGPGAEAPRL